VLPTWTLSLATIAASNALIALGIVVLARTGNVSFGQGLFFAAGGYGVALIANAWGLTDAVAQVIIGAVCGGLLGLVIGPLIARYSGIFFGMLTLALSMVFYGALVKSTALGGSDGFNVGRPSLFGMSFTDPREADFMLYAVSVIVTGFAGIAATILFRSEFGLASLAVRENNLRVEYLGLSANRVITINFVIAAIFAGASGAFALMAQRHIDPQFAYWTTSGEFVFVAVLAGTRASPPSSSPRWRWNWSARSRTSICPIPGNSCSASSCSASSCFCRAASARSGSGTGIKQESTPQLPSRPEKGAWRREPGAFRARARQALWRGGRRRRLDPRYTGRPEGQPDRRQRRRQDHLRQHGHGLSEADSGSIVLDGMDIGRRSPRSVARLGISRSFQIPQLFIELTAAENLTWRFPASARKRLSFHSPADAQGRHDKALELLGRFGLADLADRPISELAGGVRKLIDIAMALVRRPKLLLLDEPTSGVSAEEKFATMDRVIHAVAPDAATIVFVEHDMEIVSRYADRVVAFYQGRILADGEPADVLKDQEVRRYVTGGAR
jgi:ABC-type branched-subunit amino acid transport system ATPase component/ABC-type branched-subunit amino acid transport system permease subunit